jgi:hypothetical protein
MKTLLPTLLTPLLLLTAAPAFADDKAACLDAASKGQTLRDAHKLVEARDLFRRCARQQCPAMVQQDCGNWLGEVERDLPTVVVTAKDSRGGDLAQVQVSVDGQPLVTNLDGEAVPVNPGPHVFHFETADGAQLDQHVLVKAGEKNQAIAVVLAGKPAVLPPPSATPAPTSPPVEPSAPPPTEGASAWKSVGWVLGGIGAAGLGVGAVFGVIAIGDKGGAHCDANNVCDPGSISGLKSAARVSDIGLIGGGALLVGGAALVLLAPSRGPERAAAFQITPTWTANGGGIAVGRTW